MQRPVSKGQDSRSPSPPSTSLPVPVRSTSDAKDHSPVDECKGEEASDITMELELGPPSRVVAGLQLSSPIVVVLKSPKAKAAASDSGTQGQNLGGIWAYLSLMSADGRTSLSPPRTDLLLGQPVASVHKYPESSMVDNTAFAYAKFPGLSITAPGSYRLRINIIDMHRLVSQVL